MIRYNDWGQHIRLVNWLFLYVGINFFKEKSGNSIELPDYFLWKYLKNPPVITTLTDNEEVFHFRETLFSQSEQDYIIDYFTQNKDRVINVNLGSHLQSELWWNSDKDFVKNLLEFKEEELARIKNKYSYILNKKTIGIGVRRGDFVNHGCFYQIPVDWYTRALKENFPDWEQCNILFFSDDIEEVKKIFKGDNFYFSEPNNTHTHAENFKHYHNDPRDQFILGTLCNGFIGGNSTFSWWQMYIVDINGFKVVHCGENLAGDCLKKYNNPNYYPSNWIKHNI
jgi:hypothetical protein